MNVAFVIDFEQAGLQTEQEIFGLITSEWRIKAEARKRNGLSSGRAGLGESFPQKRFQFVRPISFAHGDITNWLALWNDPSVVQWRRRAEGDDQGCGDGN